MAAIVISRGCYHRGSEVAKKAAAALGYACISREVLLEASSIFDIPELKLMHAIKDAPSLLERFGRDRKSYITYIRTALLRRIQEGNVVYHGFAGHFFLQGIPGILKVRIVADLEERIRDEMEREGVTAEEARQTVIRDDDERRRWALSLYGVDPADPDLYDMILRIGPQTVDDAARIVAQASSLPAFQMNPGSKGLLNDWVLASQVEALLVADFPRIQVTARNGEAFVRLNPGLSIQRLLTAKEEIIENVALIAIGLGGADKAHVNFA